MADLRIPPQSLVPLAKAQPAGRADAINAAQRAFFQAALNGAVAQSPAPAAAPAGAKPAEPAAPPRLPRPGSLLDIKV